MKRLKHKRAKIDKIHYNFRKCDSYNKKYNFIVGPRCLGKSTAIWRKAYKIFRKTGRPCIVLRRNVADITDVYITSIRGVINKFLDESKMVDFTYTKATKDGTMDIYIENDIFIRIHALNVPESRQKSLYLESPSMIIFDEFILNNANGEKYLKNEYGRFKSLETTYAREVQDETGEVLKCYFMGNPYSIFNPYWANLITVDYNDIKPGCFLVGKNYVLECPPLSDELKQWCIDHGLWDEEVDDEYNRYAFGGEAINDNHIVVKSKQPDGYKLKYIFRIQNKYVAIFKDNRQRETIGYDVGKFWCRLMSNKEISQERLIYAVDFTNLVSGSRLMNTDQRALLWRLKECISKRDIAYQSIEVGYLVEEIYKSTL